MFVLKQLKRDNGLNSVLGLDPDERKRKNESSYQKTNHSGAVPSVLRPTPLKGDQEEDNGSNKQKSSGEVDTLELSPVVAFDGREGEKEEHHKNRDCTDGSVLQIDKYVSDMELLSLSAFQPKLQYSQCRKSTSKKHDRQRHPPKAVQQH